MFNGLGLTKNVLKTEKKMKKIILVILFFALVSCESKDFLVSKEKFTVATLNVDGLPAQILGISVNPDGPGATYMPLVSIYLARHKFDFIGVQENFNYNKELCSALNTSFNHDVWSGGIYSDCFNNDLSNPRYRCDGLMGFWRKEMREAEMVARVEWIDNYGLFSHCWDNIATKGFRRYELTLAGNSEVVIYNMHMDASDPEDEQLGLDGPDREARLNQWRQLRDHILAHLDERPVIVLGDLNSYYVRDSIVHVFVDSIQSTGRATVGDVWVELVHGGRYPDLISGIISHDDGVSGWMRQGETLDKILYVNPVGGRNIKPLSITLDTLHYMRNDSITPLGDHFPLWTQFQFTD